MTLPGITFRIYSGAIDAHGPYPVVVPPPRPAATPLPLVTRSISIPQSNGTFSSSLYIGDLTDLIIVESNLLNLSAVYDFEFSLDQTNWAVPITATTINDTETAYWKVRGQQSSPTVGTIEIIIPRTNYLRIKTITYSGGSGLIVAQGRPS